MPHDHLGFTGSDREKGNLSDGEISGSLGTEVKSAASVQSQSQGDSEVPRQEISDKFTQRLGIATSRALERRLGMPPNQADVCRVVDTLTSHPSHFLQCAERAQARLARLHSQLQIFQGQQSPIDIAEELIVTPIVSNKRLLEEPDHNSSDQQVKRVRVECGNPNPNKSPPPLNPENAVQAPSAPMAQKHAPIAPQGTLSDDQGSSCASPHVIVGFPPQTPVMGIEQSTSTDHSRSSSGQESGEIEESDSSPNTADDGSHGNCEHIEGTSTSQLASARSESLPESPPAQEMAPLAEGLSRKQKKRLQSSKRRRYRRAAAKATEEALRLASSMHTGVEVTNPEASAGTPTSGAPSPLTILGTQPQDVIGSRTDLNPNSPALPGVAVAMDLPANTRQEAPSSAPVPPFTANVPGIWAIQVGKPSTCQIDLPFVVDQDTAECVRRWATRRQGFDPHLRHVAVHLVALQATAVSAAQKALSQSPGSMTPQAFALALHDLQPQWPDDGTLVLQVNVGQPGDQSWFASDMSAGKSLDVSAAVLAGTNSLRILQLRNMAELVFALYATSPTAEMMAAAIELERQRTMYTYRRPHSKRLGLFG